jgi:hypothetical protein
MLSTMPLSLTSFELYICSIVAGFPEIWNELSNGDIHKSPFTYVVRYSSAWGPDDSSQYFKLYVTIKDSETTEVDRKEPEFELLS